MIKALSIALVIAGAFFICNSELAAMLSKLCRTNLLHVARQKVEQWQRRRKRTLKQKLMQMHAGNKENFISKAYSTMTAIMTDTGAADKIRLMKVLSFACGAFGVAVSLYIGSIMLVPILGVGLALLPMWLIKFKAYRHNVLVMNELSVVLSMVSNSYKRCENIVRAVEENLGYMNEPIRAHFQWFTTVSRQVSADISGNLEGLKRRLDNPIFKLWCDNLIMCQKDINQKHSLNAVVEQFAAERELLNMLSSEISKPVKIYVAIAGLTMLAFPTSIIISNQFSAGDAIGNLLLSTFTGQCIVVGYAITLLFGINKAIELSTTI